MTHVDTEVAGVRDGRTGDAQMHLGGAGVAQQFHERAGGGATHQRIVDHHHPLAGEILRQRIELQCHAAIAQVLRGLDERAADVTVLDEAVVVRDTARPAVPDGSGDAAVD